MLSPEFDAKIGQISKQYKGIKRFKLTTMLWVCQSILVARSVCLQKIAQDNAHIGQEEQRYRQRLGKLRCFFIYR
mgnify:FL=1